MKILAIDTATARGSVALTEDDRIVVELIWDLPPGKHTERLVPSIDGLLETAGWTYADLEAVAVTRGPGSFTGLRVGIATAKAVALAHELPLVGISTLEALAWNGRATDALVVPMLDARKQEVYAAAYQPSDSGLEPVMAEQVASPEDVLEALAARPEPRIVLLGDGVAAYRDRIEAHLGPRARVMEGALGLPHAGNLAARARLALSEAGGGPAEALQPTYLRRPEAVGGRPAAEKKSL